MIPFIVLSSYLGNQNSFEIKLKKFKKYILRLLVPSVKRVHLCQYVCIFYQTDSRAGMRQYQPNLCLNIARVLPESNKVGWNTEGVVYDVGCPREDKEILEKYT
jgi:hypothetical protein